MNKEELINIYIELLNNIDTINEEMHLDNSAIDSHYYKYIDKTNYINKVLYFDREMFRLEEKMKAIKEIANRMGISIEEERRLAEYQQIKKK